MLKRTLALIATIMATAVASAQNIQETTVQVGDITVPAYTVSISQDEGRTSSVLKKQFKAWGVSTTKSNGFVIVIAETITDLSSSPVNFYTKVDEQGKRDNKITVVTFAAVSTNLSDDQSQLNQRTRQLLANFVKEVARDEANEKMSVVQKALDKAVKAAGAATAAAASLDNDNIKLQGKIDSKKKDIEKLNEKIAKMQKDIADYEAEIEKNNGKKAEYTQKAADAGKQVEALNAEIEGYKSAIQ